MRLGVGTYSYRWALGMGELPQTMNLTDVLHRVHALGVGLLQIADSAELDTASDDHLRSLSVLAQRLDIDIQIGTTGATTAVLLRYLHIAQLLRADAVRLVLHQHADDVDEESAVETLRSVSGGYGAADVSIAIENHFLTTSPAMIRLLERVDSPHVRVVLDVANSIVCGEWPRETIEALAPYAVGLHLKDYDIVPDANGVGAHLIGAPLGRGRLDLVGVFSALERAGALTPDFAIVLEHWAPRGCSDDDAYRTEQEWLEGSLPTARTLLSTFEAKEAAHVE